MDVWLQMFVQNVQLVASPKSLASIIAPGLNEIEIILEKTDARTPNRLRLVKTRARMAGAANRNLTTPNLNLNLSLGGWAQALASSSRYCWATSRTTSVYGL
jgi:hypothetical protein